VGVLGWGTAIGSLTSLGRAYRAGVRRAPVPDAGLWTGEASTEVGTGGCFAAGSGTSRAGSGALELCAERTDEP
jgi:hypothetical protein